MSLLTCIECNHEVSEYADKCPNCGCPIDVIKNNKNKSSLKKITLQDIGIAKVKAIKIVREVTGLGLTEAKEITDNAPILFYKGLSKDKAIDIKHKFEEIGAIVLLKKNLYFKKESQSQIHLNNNHPINQNVQPADRLISIRFL